MVWLGTLVEDDSQGFSNLLFPGSFCQLVRDAFNNNSNVFFFFICMHRLLVKLLIIFSLYFVFPLSLQTASVWTMKYFLRCSISSMPRATSNIISIQEASADKFLSRIDLSNPYKDLLEDTAALAPSLISASPTSVYLNLTKRLTSIFVSSCFL